ncbi:YncE family protein [Streptomyces sp. NPDC001595]|uniref:YncE family protein n=1 Tax=Streptomyces sp. NPDC001532 TaxID=3154520 RepID=UPI00331B43C9
MRRTRLRAVLGALLLTLLALLGGAPGAAAAPAATANTTTTALPVSWHADTAVDAVHQRLYIADIVTGSIVVTDFDGRVLRTLTGLPGAADLVLSPDARTLYVALSRGDAIAAVDTATYRTKARYATGDGTAPLRLALVDGTLWFSYGDQWDSNLGSLAPGRRPAVRLAHLPQGTWAGPPMLLSSPAAPGLVIAADQYSTAGTVTVYDVTSGAPAVRTTQNNPGGIYDVRDLALTPDGGTLFAVSGAPYHHVALRLADLSVADTYPTGSYPDAVAVAPDGTIAAGIDQSYGEDVFLFAPGADTPFQVVDLDPGSALALRPHGLVWSPDGTRLFALTGEYGSALNLHVIRR